MHATGVDMEGLGGGRRDAAPVGCCTRQVGWRSASSRRLGATGVHAGGQPQQHPLGSHTGCAARPPARPCIPCAMTVCLPQEPRWKGSTLPPVQVSPVLHAPVQDTALQQHRHGTCGAGRKQGRQRRQRGGLFGARAGGLPSGKAAVLHGFLLMCAALGRPMAAPASSNPSQQ